MGMFSDILGTTKQFFQLGLGGVKIKNSSGNLVIRNAADNADAEITASKVNVSGDDLVLNSDAAESGADWKITLRRPSTGMTQDVILKLPANKGTSGQVLGTDGNDPTQLSWISAASTADCIHVNHTVINHGDSSPATAMTLPANAYLLMVEVLLDTPFNGTTPVLSVGIAGTVSKYMGTTDNNLVGTAGDVYQVNPSIAPNVSSESIIITFNDGTSTAGSCRVLLHYTTPS